MTTLCAADYFRDLATDHWREPTNTRLLAASLCAVAAHEGATIMNAVTQIKSDQRDLSRSWAETNEDRAAEYQEWADYYKQRAADCALKAKHYRRVAKADREVLK